MNMLLLEPEDMTAPNAARVSGRRFDELLRIGVEVGKFCRAGMRGGLTGRAEVLRIEPDAIVLRPDFDTPAPAKSELVLIAALPRPQTLDKVIHAAVTMGVEELWFIHTRKVEKSYWDSSKLHPDHLKREIDLALEQCGDTIAPRLEFRRRFRPFVEDELPVLASGRSAWFGDPAATEPVRTVSGAKLLAVGPEGGFTDFESEMLRRAGLTGVTLGPRILRTEFAVAALLAMLGM